MPQSWGHGTHIFYFPLRRKACLRNFTTPEKSNGFGRGPEASMLTTRPPKLCIAKFGWLCININFAQSSTYRPDVSTMKFDVSKAVFLKFQVFWDITTCRWCKKFSDVSKYRDVFIIKLKQSKTAFLVNIYQLPEFVAIYQSSRCGIINNWDFDDSTIGYNHSSVNCLSDLFFFYCLSQ
jgi:hypothetical protein